MFGLNTEDCAGQAENTENIFKLNETKGEGREMNLCFIANNFAWIDLEEVREVRLSTHLLREHMRSSIWSLILQAWWIMAL